ncbi:uncharacterized protein LOC135683144 [Rhopilema esculentum]|uniref:uncharacterized protein LOC135683144 n=1 Tax=Rhopilema esculentum TaxID=499914 RepID=UPI0031DE6201
MAGRNISRALVLKKTISANRRRRKMLQYGVALLLKHQSMIIAYCLAATLAFAQHNQRRIVTRSCRRLKRNEGWWELLWDNYDDDRFKKTFRVSRETFNFVLESIRHKLERDTLCEEPFPPELRLGLCLYRLGRGDYFYTIAEMAGLAPCTVSTIVHDVNEAIVSCLWKKCVSAHMPVSEEDFNNKMLDMEEIWQFLFSWCAVDGCHIPIKCPPGGQESSKEYHNFKNFYSIVLMSMVDARYRFIWGSCGFPGNSHDSIILQSTSLWSSIKEGKVLQNFAQCEEDVHIPPIILGDSAFPFGTFLMKPYTNAVLSKEQRYFNYRLSRARMVVEGAYGQLKGRWRLLLKKSEGNLYQTKMATLSCMVLHNLCIEKNDTIPSKLDLSVDPSTQQKRDRATLCNVLLMKASHKIVDPRRNQADKIRTTITRKLQKELQTLNFNETLSAN